MFVVFVIVVVRVSSWGNLFFYPDIPDGFFFVFLSCSCVGVTRWFLEGCERVCLLPLGNWRWIFLEIVGFG